MLNPLYSRRANAMVIWDVTHQVCNASGDSSVCARKSHEKLFVHGDIECNAVVLHIKFNLIYLKSVRRHSVRVILFVPNSTYLKEIKYSCKLNVRDFVDLWLLIVSKHSKHTSHATISSKFLTTSVFQEPSGGMKWFQNANRNNSIPRFEWISLAWPIRNTYNIRTNSNRRQKQFHVLNIRIKYFRKL